MKCDVIVIGSGASGAVAASMLCDRGYEVVLLEEGERISRDDFRPDVYSTMYRMFRDHGMQTARGSALIPVLQGRCVGGSTVINGAIVHRLPEEIFDQWKAAGLVDGISYSEIDRHGRALESKLGVKANIEKAFRGTALSRILSSKDWQHEVMRRNAPGCESSGRCLQGCPTGGKWSMERSLLPHFESIGGRIIPDMRAVRITRKGQAWCVECVDGRRQSHRFVAPKIVLAAGAIHSADLLWKSGLRNPALGKNFQMHLSVGVSALFDVPVASVQGPPQGVEVTEFRNHRLKLATQLMPPEMALARTSLVGAELSELTARPEYISNWMASIQSDVSGEIRFSRFGKPSLYFEPSARDLQRASLGISRISELLFEMGAVRVFPGICPPGSGAWDLKSRGEIIRLERVPFDPRFFLISAGHLFGGTCLSGVITPNFEVMGMEGIHVVDAGIFPSSIGVNPQHAIMALAAVATDRM